MFGFLKRQPPENKLLLAELKRISENYTGPNIFDRIVAKAAAEEISSAMKKIRASRKTPFPKAVGQPVMLHISSCRVCGKRSPVRAFARLQGVMNDQGHAYLRLYKACIGALMKSGRYSNLEGVEALTELEEAISEVG